MEVIASDLKQALDYLNSVISTKGLVENCDKFVFNKEGIFAFNGEALVAVNFKSDIKGAVQGSTFYKIIDKHNTNKININIDGENLIVKKGKSQSTFAFDSEAKCPIPLKIKKWNDLPANFLEAMNVCVYTTGKDYTDMRTVCIHVKGAIAESSDSFRMSVFKLENEIKDELFIPTDTLKFFNKCNPIKYCKTNDWCYYQDLNGTIVCHRNISFSDAYPDLQAIMASNDGYYELELPEKLYDSLEKASVFLDGKVENDKFVHITSNAGKLKILSKGNGGQYSETLKVSFKDKIKFDVHPNYMMSAIERNSTIHINDNTIKISSESCTNLICLTVGTGDKE